MPHLICPTYRLAKGRAAGHATIDRYPQCDTSLRGGQRLEGITSGRRGLGGHLG
jgi:hypothetical protein